MAFHRLIMPDGFSVSLDQFKGLNQIGETALRDKVNNHYLRIFGLSVALGLISGFSNRGVTYTVPALQGPNCIAQASPKAFLSPRSESSTATSTSFLPSPSWKGTASRCILRMTFWCPTM